jgi:hypothetical protein
VAHDRRKLSYVRLDATVPLQYAAVPLQYGFWPGSGMALAIAGHTRPSATAADDLHMKMTDLNQQAKDLFGDLNHFRSNGK